MKKIVMLLALVLCLMMAATAMAATGVEPKYTTLPANPNIQSNDKYEIEFKAYNQEYISGSPLPDDFVTQFVLFMKKQLGTDDFKYMIFDAEGLKNETKIEVPESNGAQVLTVVFGSDFFNNAKIRNAIVAYGNRSGFYIYDTDVLDNGTKVQAQINHLTPVMIAWTEDTTPVAAPLEAPDMPSTGDSSSLPGLFILLGMSLAAMGAMKLRRREN